MKVGRPSLPGTSERLEFISANQGLSVREMSVELQISEPRVWNLIKRYKLNHGGHRKLSKILPPQIKYFNIYSRANWLI